MVIYHQLHVFPVVSFTLAASNCRRLLRFGLSTFARFALPTVAAERPEGVPTAYGCAVPFAQITYLAELSYTSCLIMLPPADERKADSDIVTDAQYNHGRNEPAKLRTQKSSSPPYTNVQWLFIVFAVYSSAFLYGLDTTIVSIVQGPVVERFGNVEKLGWLGIGFPLGSVATIASWAKAYGVFDTKWMYVGSLVHFAAGSSLCAAAPTMNALIVGRVWAGAGGAGMYLG